MNGLRRDVLRLALLVVLWTAYVILPAPIGAQGEGGEEYECDNPAGCVGGCSAHNPNYACCEEAWGWPDAQWDDCESGDGGCIFGEYCVNP